MRLRPYDPGDWQRLCAIHDAARRHELEASGLADAFLTLEQTAQNEGLFDGAVVVADVGGTVQGFAAFADGELTWLYVDPAMARQGIGRRLLQHVIQASGGTLSTEVLLGNEPALALYLSEGFKLLRRVDGKLAGNESFAASGYVLERVVAMDPAQPGGDLGA
jgi:ribosomal protein S18 acetylase RimI-like enzyme